MSLGASRDPQSNLTPSRGIGSPLWWGCAGHRESAAGRPKVIPAAEKKGSLRRSGRSWNTDSLSAPTSPPPGNKVCPGAEIPFARRPDEGGPTAVVTDIERDSAPESMRGQRSDSCSVDPVRPYRLPCRRRAARRCVVAPCKSRGEALSRPRCLASVFNTQRCPESSA